MNSDTHRVAKYSDFLVSAEVTYHPSLLTQNFGREELIDKCWGLEYCMATEFQAISLEMVYRVFPR